MTDYRLHVNLNEFYSNTLKVEHEVLLRSSWFHCTFLQKFKPVHIFNTACSCILQMSVRRMLLHPAPPSCGIFRHRYHKHWFDQSGLKPSSWLILLIFSPRSVLLKMAESLWTPSTLSHLSRLQSIQCIWKYLEKWHDVEHKYSVLNTKRECWWIQSSLSFVQIFLNLQKFNLNYSNS